MSDAYMLRYFYNIGFMMLGSYCHLHWRVGFLYFLLSELSLILMLSYMQCCSYFSPDVTKGGTITSEGVVNRMGYI